MATEGIVIYRSGWCKLVRHEGVPRGVRYFRIGEVVELRLGGQWVPVRIACGGYNGWYYATPQGHRGRLAGCRVAAVKHPWELEAWGCRACGEQAMPPGLTLDAGG